MAEELKGRALKVYKIMEQHEGARNNDWTLMAHYINKYYKRLTHTDANGDAVLRLKDMKKLPSWQTIRLARQIIQNTQGLLLPTDPKVTKMRKIKERDIKDCEYREATQINFETK